MIKCKILLLKHGYNLVFRTLGTLCYGKRNLLKNGIFCLNKEEITTSAQCVQIVKKAILKELRLIKEGFKLKVGHGGTLDYGATGVLVIGINDGCKLLTHFLRGKKCYLVTGKLGEATDTYNSIGKVTHRSTFDHITRDSFMHSLNNFHGIIMQVPPPYCALKMKGKRISDLIRQGEEVHLSPRSVYCEKIECVSYDLPYFTLLVSCGGGFYIRSLVHDIGIAHSSCAHVTKLCRIKQGPLELEDCLLMKQLTLENILHACDSVRCKYSEGFKTAEK